MIRWKEVQDVGRKKAKWDGNGKERGWEKKREKEQRNKLYSFNGALIARYFSFDDLM